MPVPGKLMAGNQRIGIGAGSVNPGDIGTADARGFDLDNDLIAAAGGVGHVCIGKISDGI